MRLVLGSRQYDLTTRALVLGVSGAPGEGADIVEPCARRGAGPVPVSAVASDEVAVEQALAHGVDLVRLSDPSPGSLQRCAAAGAAVVVPASAYPQATASGLPPERIVLATLLVDVTAAPCPLAATVAGVIAGARIVRTAEVRSARRVCDVLAAVFEAGDR